MSVLIKGMEMPKNCIFCELYEPDLYWCRAAKKEYYETIENKAHPDWCPLIELPPHGRLIDADALPLTEGWFNPDKERNVYQTHIIFVLENDIKNAPTIIEAEGEE